MRDADVNGVASRSMHTSALLRIFLQLSHVEC